MNKIGYFKIHIKEENYLGGILISDERGIPVEFKYTEPVKPTKVQKVLYGKSLEKFLIEEIIMANLIEKIEIEPAIYFIDDKININIKRLLKTDVVMLKKTQLKPSKEPYKYKFIKENEAIVQLEEGTNPIRVIILDEDIEKKDELVQKIIELSKESYIIEPFFRLEEALEMILKGEI
ncbi:hypothetical protein [Haliovirga abyssi]|uniref:Uncharacterized protein n=1 Tax=Haliovirga abyssi TaxID=2996794 RepID=A0AAU9DXL9_9FUSO|nr:hypothetical protein [Haliovirga abyssi]BDU50135.1 hypothetical protein HLVA_07040 [Haliovirga abyssi]